MRKQNNIKNFISDYLTKVMAKGRYTVSFEELQEKFTISNKALLQNIYRLKRKNKLAQVRKGFYVVIPPQYSIRVMIPPTLFIDDMMKHLHRDYYIGLLSASALHGVSNQQPMEFQIITQKNALRKIKNNKLIIHFFTKINWEENQIIKIKTETGFIDVSTLELTAFDLVRFHKQIGGLNRIVPIIDSLSEEIKPSLLSQIADNQPYTVIQRLGFLLEKLEKRKLSDSLLKSIKRSKMKKTVLSLSHKSRTGDIDEQWKIIINTELDL